MSADDPFTLLELPRRYEKPTEQLTAALRKASLAWHPDRFALAPAPEREAAEAKMAELNQAFAALSDPLDRAALLLDLKPDQVPASPAFLMEMMERREAIAEAQAAGDGERLAHLLEALEQDYHQHLERLAQATHTADAAAAAVLTEATYLKRSLEDLRP